MPEQKTIWLGIDVGKKSCSAALDLLPEVPVASEGFPVCDFPNSKQGVIRLLHWVDKNLSGLAEAPQVRAVMEVTGVYSRSLEGYLTAQRSSLQPALINGNVSNAYRKSLSLKNATDRMDARLLARFGTERHPLPHEKPALIYARLSEMCRLRDSYTSLRSNLSNRHESLCDPMMKKMDTELQNKLSRTIEGIEQQIKKLIHEHKELQQEINLLITTPGIGLISAATLLGELGSLRDYATRNDISAMSGLNPVVKQSGTSVHRSHLSKKGSRLLRKILYMDSLSSVPRIPQLNAFYQRLIQQGKKPLTARCACMRKLLLILRSMVVNNTPFDPDFLKKGEINA